ncbi:MAG TPA: cytochrome c [Burkholderiales bacterium]|jgi:mono/diheme cytochrome c family protein|nr:cytochrome c [Burkholderiales bacterium]
MRIALLLMLVLLAGCERLARNMYEQPRYRPMQESRLFPDGSSARAPVPNTVPAADGVLAGTSSGRLGAELEKRRSDLEKAQSMPFPVTLDLLRRGRERYEIYCVPCHSPLGDGDGRVARRGFPHPPSYHQPRLREAPDRHFYDVMTNGYGIMRSYADRVPPEDRWAIVAYVRALQLSQNPRAEAK